jgi:uncharacterized protein (DUF2267 family)
MEFDKGVVPTMTVASRDHAGWLIDGRTWWLDREMVEHTLLLSGYQAADLERLAHSRQLTVGQLLRLIIREFLASETELEANRKEPVDLRSMPIPEKLVFEKERTMNQGAMAAFDSTIQTTNIWLNDILEQLGWEGRHRAYQALRAVLHALRDRLSVDQAASLAAQLPMLVRGIYYEGWHPHGKPLKERHKEEFLLHIETAFRDDPDVNAELVVKAVFQVLAKHVASGEIEILKHNLPSELRSLWTEDLHTVWS